MSNPRDLSDLDLDAAFAAVILATRTWLNYVQRCVLVLQYNKVLISSYKQLCKVCKLCSKYNINSLSH